MAGNVPKRTGKGGGRGTTETRARLIAFLCALAAFFAFGLFLFLDSRRVEHVEAMRASAADAASARKAAPPARADERPAVPPPAAQAGSQPPSEAQAEPDMKPQAQAEPRTEPEAPSRVARVSPQTLNGVLKAASSGDWALVDDLLTDTSASVGSGAKAATSELTDQGKQAIAAGDYEQAIEKLSAAIAADPQDADALNELALALLREGKLEVAYANVARSLELSPGRAATWANAAEILAERDNALASQAALRVAIHLAPDRERTRRFLAQAKQTVPGAKFRDVITEVLPQFDQIPRAGRSTS